MCVHGILQVTILEWVAIPSPGDLPDSGSSRLNPGYPGLHPGYPGLQADSLLSELPGQVTKGNTTIHTHTQKTDLLYNTLFKISSYQLKITRHVIK